MSAWKVQRKIGKCDFRNWKWKCKIKEREVVLKMSVKGKRGKREGENGED